MTTDKNEGRQIKKEDHDSAAERGKKAIEAEKIALGKDPASRETERKEEMDAENWRNEG